MRTHDRREGETRESEMFALSFVGTNTHTKSVFFAFGVIKGFRFELQPIHKKRFVVYSPVNLEVQRAIAIPRCSIRKNDSEWGHGQCFGGL